MNSGRKMFVLLLLVVYFLSCCTSGISLEEGRHITAVEKVTPEQIRSGIRGARIAGKAAKAAKAAHAESRLSAAALSHAQPFSISLVAAIMLGFLWSI